VSSVKHTCNTCTWSQIMYILAHSRFVFQKASLTFNNYLKKKNDNCKRVSANKKTHKRIDVYKRQYQFSKVSNGECSRSGNLVHDVILFGYGVSRRRRIVRQMLGCKSPEFKSFKKINPNLSSQVARSQTSKSFRHESAANPADGHCRNETDFKTI